MDAEQMQNVLDVPESTVPGFAQEAVETTETTEPAPVSPDTLLDKPFSEYTVTEGLLLIIALLLLLSLLMRTVKEGFHWL